MVKLGIKREGEPSRTVKVEVDGKTLLLATDLDPEAGLIALIYRYRWQIELFFKWFKSIPGCRHLMAGSPEGVVIQTYSALIAALMLQLLTGKRPGKRAMELIRFYMTGYAELEEVIALLTPKKSAGESTGNCHAGSCRGLPCPDGATQSRNVRKSPPARRSHFKTGAFPGISATEAPNMPNTSGQRHNSCLSTALSCSLFPESSDDESFLPLQHPARPRLTPQPFP